jgi:hypothetical protein
MNIVNLNLLPQTAKTLWRTYTDDLAERDAYFAELMERAAMHVHEPTCIATDNVSFSALGTAIRGVFPVLVVFPPVGLLDHLTELTLTAPMCMNRDSTDLLNRATYMAWLVGGLATCLPLQLVLDLIDDMTVVDEVLEEPIAPTHLAVMFVTGSETAVQVVALDEEFFDDVACHMACAGPNYCPAAVHSATQLAAVKHRGPAYLYADQRAATEDETVCIDLRWRRFNCIAAHYARPV